MRTSRKDQILLEQAYQSVNEAPFKFNDANSFHSDEGYDTGPEDVPSHRKSTPAAGAGMPKYSKMATGQDYPEVDEFVHMWFTKSNVGGSGGPTYWQQYHDIPNDNIQDWFEDDKKARKFFLQNKLALIKAAVKMTQAHQSVNEAPFKFNDANSFHSDEGYDTGPEDVPQYGSTKSSSPKTYHPATVRAFRKLMAMIEEHVEDMPPELLDKVVARLQRAKQAWGK
jgi:hypothetical protein